MKYLFLFFNLDPKYSEKESRKELVIKFIKATCNLLPENEYCFYLKNYYFSEELKNE